MKNKLNNITTAVRGRARALIATGERGASAVEWILITVAAIALVAIVVAAVTAFVNTQVGQLGG